MGGDAGTDSLNTGTSTVDSLTVTNYTGYPLILTSTLSGNTSGYYSIPSLGSLSVPSSPR